MTNQSHSGLISSLQGLSLVASERAGCHRRGGASREPTRASSGGLHYTEVGGARGCKPAANWCREPAGKCLEVYRKTSSGNHRTGRDPAHRPISVFRTRQWGRFRHGVRGQTVWSLSAASWHDRIRRDRHRIGDRSADHSPPWRSRLGGRTTRKRREFLFHFARLNEKKAKRRIRGNNQPTGLYWLLMNELPPRGQKFV